MKTSSTLAVLAIAGLAGAHAALIADDFDTDTSANYTVVDDGTPDGTAIFAYDYSAAGIPSAPNSVGGTTSGLRFTANDSAGASDAITAFHTTTVGGSYRLSVDIWMNVSGTGGTTEHFHVGVGGDGATFNSLFSPISGSGHFLAVTGEGGSASDFRHYTPGVTSVPSGDASYLNDLMTTNATGDTYQAIFAGGDFPGSPGNRWTTLTIDVFDGGDVIYAFDGTPIIRTLNETVSGQVSLGHADLFSSVANPFQSQFVVYDNLSVEVIPEPSAGVLALLGAALALRRRRR